MKKNGQKFLEPTLSRMKDQMRRWHFLSSFVAIFLLLLQACIPYPHRRMVIPIQVGNLTANGKPKVGAKILRSFAYKDGQCAHASESTTTDEQGAFSFPARSEFFLFIGMGDQNFSSSLCLQEETQVRWLTYFESVHESNVSSRRYLCDLSKPLRGSNTNTSLPVLPCIDISSRETLNKQLER